MPYLDEYKGPFASVIPLGVIGNAMLITVIVSDKRLHTSATLYNAVMAVSGLFHSATGMLWYLLIVLNEMPLEVCRKTIGLTFIGLTLKTCLWLGQAVDRWIFVFKPLRYYELVTMRRTVFVCVALVVYSLAISLTHGWTAYDASRKILRTFDMIETLTNNSAVITDSETCLRAMLGNANFIVFLFYGNYLSFILASVILYSSILIVAKRRAKAIGVVSKAGSSQVQSDIRLQAQSTRQRGALLVLVSLLFCLLAWLPLLIVIGLDQTSASASSRLYQAINESQFYAAQIMIINAEMSLNPWLLAFGQRDFRRAAFCLFARWLPVRGSRDNTSSKHRQQRGSRHGLAGSTAANVSVVNVD